MTNKYRIFYTLHYRGNDLDYEEDIKARTITEAVRKARRFIETKNNKRKEETRKTLIYNGVRRAEHFTDEQLLIRSCFRLTGVYLVTETTVEIKKEELKPVPIS